MNSKDVWVRISDARNIRSVPDIPYLFLPRRITNQGSVFLVSISSRVFNAILSVIEGWTGLVHVLVYNDGRSVEIVRQARLNRKGTRYYISLPNTNMKMLGLKNKSTIRVKITPIV